MNKKILIFFVFFFFISYSFGEEPAKYSFDNLLKSSYDNNLELLQLILQKKSAINDIKKTESSFYPKIDYSIALTHIADSSLLDPVILDKGSLGNYNIGGQIISLPQNTITIFPGIEDKKYSFNLEINQVLFTWGKLKNALNLYKESAVIKDLMIDKKKNSLKTEILANLYVIYYLNEISKIINEQKKIGERLIFISEKNYNAGFILKIDLLTAKIQVKEIELGEYKIKESIDQALITLQNISGISNLNIQNIDFSCIDTNLNNFKVENIETLKKLVQDNNMDLKILNNLKKISELKLNIAKGSSYLKPDIGLNIKLSYSGSRFPFLEADWYGKNSLDFYISIGFQAKVFDGGKIELDIIQGKDDLNNSILEIKKAEDSIEKILNQSLLKMQLAKENIEYYKIKQDIDMEKINLKKTQFMQGAINENEYLIEELNFLKDKISFYQEIINYMTHYFTITALCGK